MIPEPNRPAPKSIVCFVAGTPLLTPEGHKPIEDLKPGDFIQTQPDDDKADDEGPEPPRWWEHN
jgi:hypothetical protein